MKPIRLRPSMASWLLASGALGAACAAVPAQPDAAPADPAAATAEQGFKDAEELLGALESADQGLRALAAEVEVTKTFAMDDEVHLRTGALYFTSDPGGGSEPARRRFAVVFQQFQRGDRLEEDIQSYAFDGHWLMEKHPAQREFSLKQVVAPGEPFDPLRIGGPFPLPLGQKKADILAEYSAELLPAGDGLIEAELIEFVKGTWQVRLVPRPERAMDGGFMEVRLWYKADSSGRLLPRMARTVDATDDPEVAGDASLVRLINPKVNERAEIPDDVFDVRAPEGWNGSVIPFRAPVR